MKFPETITPLAARAVSTLFLPPCIILWCTFAIVLFSDTISGNVSGGVITILLFGVVIPIIVFIALMRIKKVSDQDAKIRTERNIPYIAGIILSIAGQAVLIVIQAPETMQYLWITYLFCTIGIFIINLYWKISAHLMSNAAGMTVLALLHLLPIWGMLILLVSIGWSRRVLKCHTFPQIIAGTAVGACIAIINYLVIF
ncbi:MAG: hypothetical protein LWX56_06645 [Ignavibacteria bacterium]|nr:hypothetical protein [Ignavibacteria bacterium]